MRMAGKRLNVALVNPPSLSVECDRVDPPLGLLYIAGTLREYGHNDVSVLDMSGCRDERAIAAKMERIPEADVYGVTCLCTNYEYARRIVAKVRSANPAAHVILGGPNPSAVPAFTLSDSGADAVCVGEGEDVFHRCVDGYASGSPPTGVLRANPRWDVDSYAFPARDLVDLTTYTRRLMGEPVISLLASRGCKYRCIHCNSTVMGGGSRCVRFRSASNVLDEMESLRDRFRCYRFTDDHFTGSPHLKPLLEGMKGLDIAFRVFARIEDLDDETCRLLKEAGCVHVAVGLESLHPDNLRVLGKAPQIGREENVRIARSHGLTVRASFMVGLPHDSDETIDKYFGKASELGLNEFAVYPLIPYPGTTVWKHPDRFGYTIAHSDFADYVQMGRQGKTCFALEHERFGPDDARRWLKRATAVLEAGGSRHMRDSVVAQ